MTIKKIAFALLTVLLAGCAAPAPTLAPGASPTSAASPSPGSFGTLPDLSISNGTTLTLSLVVNSQRIGEVPPDSQRTLQAFGLPALPWILEAQSPTGRVVMTFRAEPADLQKYSSQAQLVDLSCGRLWIWVGDVTPDAPVVPSAYPSGDCAP